MLPIKAKFKERLASRSMVDDPKETGDNRVVDGQDIIDEALSYYKALVFFQAYTIQSRSDRLLIYLILFITDCLKILSKCADKAEAHKQINMIANSKFPIPGDSDFPLNCACAPPTSAADDGSFPSYLKQLRQECGCRVCEKAFQEQGREMPTPSKWWTCFAKIKFLNLSLNS